MLNPGVMNHAPTRMLKRYIAISGNMGVGKSSLVDFLCKTFSLKPYFEPNEANPYLEDFYKDMKRWAFASQVHFLGSKFRIHQELNEETGGVIQDRTIYEDAEVFATNLFQQKIMNRRDYETYKNIYHTILKSIRPPDVMVYLTCSVRTIKRRIAERARPFELAVPTAYLNRLNKLYESWIAGYTLSPVITISTEKLDYIGDFLDRGDLLSRIETYLS